MERVRRLLHLPQSQQEELEVPEALVPVLVLVLGLVLADLLARPEGQENLVQGGLVSGVSHGECENVGDVEPGSNGPA